ncbi:hypothetical protein ES705_43387 [subsurface metagenome]
MILVNIFVPTLVFNQIKFIFDIEVIKRVEKQEDAQLAILSFSLLNEYRSKKKEENKKTLYIALSNEDLDVFKNIKNSDIILEELNFNQSNSILKFGNIGIDAKDKLISFLNNDIALLREDMIFCYIYFTEYSRKLSPKLVKDIFEHLLNEFDISYDEFPKFPKKIWGAMQRSFTFLLEYKGLIEMKDFNRIAETEETEEWVNIFINLEIFEIVENQIGLKDGFEEKLKALRKKWKELNSILLESENNG